nr:cytochrome b [Acharax sp. NY-2022]
MLLPIRKTDPTVKLLTNALYDLPAPLNLSIWWNFGSLLGLCLTLQILTGVFLAMHYISSVDLAFETVTTLTIEIKHGWLIRNMHANGGTFFFICMYAHIGRSLYYGSYMNNHTWNVGILILIISMMTAFLGYILPWGQMSLWAATVITSMFSAIPYLGNMMVAWIWGGYSVAEPTLNRFYALHFLFPFILVGLSAIHMMLLHEETSNNPLGVVSTSDKIPFHIYYTLKDFVGFMVLLITLITLSNMDPNMLIDSENYIIANQLVTPESIMPEWYFLFAYAILRAAPSKLGGVIALMMSVLILFIMPLIHNGQFRSCSLYPVNQFIFWVMLSSLAILTWIGACPMYTPFKEIGSITTWVYFGYYISHPINQWMMKKWYNKSYKNTILTI